jgi:hypothetical protein
MRKIMFITTVILLLVFVANPVAAQEMKKIAQAGLQFLKIDPAARSASMGGAMTVVDYNSSAMFFNPAGMARMEKQFDISLNTNQWIADIQYNSFGAAYTFEGIGTFGVNGIFSDYGDIPGAQLADNEQGFIVTDNIDVNAYAVGLSYAVNLSSSFAIGATARYVSQNLGSSLMNDNSMKKNEVSGFTFDFGTVFYPGWKSFRFGISVKNFGDELTYERESFETPMTFTFGVAMNIFDLTAMEDQTLLLTVDAVHPRDYSERVRIGGEYLLFNMFAFRAGYVTNHDVMGASAGLGFFYDISGVGLRIDYSYSDTQYFDAVQRISAGFSF